MQDVYDEIKNLVRLLLHVSEEEAKSLVGRHCVKNMMWDEHKKVFDSTGLSELFKESGRIVEIRMLGYYLMPLLQELHGRHEFSVQYASGEKGMYCEYDIFTVMRIAAKILVHQEIQERDK